MPDYKPSAVDLFGSFPPLCATFDHSEAEAMGALMCRALDVLGDEWRPIGWSELIGVIRADVAAAKDNPEATTIGKLMLDMSRNPFVRPDPHDLVKRGFAAWTDAPGGLLAFTEIGFERLRRWVR